MKFDILTIFPEVCDAYFNESILKRAQESGKVIIKTHNIRDFATDKHKTVDDKPYGGGVGMVMKIEPVVKCLESIEKGPNTKVFLLSPRGALLDQQYAQELASDEIDHVILICGRYEGIDQRIHNFIDGELSIGNFVLTGGELGAMIVVDAVSRLLPGVLGKDESSYEETHSTPGYVEYDHYTRPEIFEYNGQEYKVPETLLSGHHAEIEEWKQQNSKEK